MPQLERIEASIAAMKSIETDDESPAGVLPKAEYPKVDDSALGQLLCTHNAEELRAASGETEV